MRVTAPVHADPTGRTREPPHCPSCSCGMRQDETTEVIRLRAALALMYDKWEYGVTCWEDGDNSGISLGNAFKLTDEEEREILSLIPSQRSAVEPAEAQCTERGPFRCQRLNGHPGNHEAYDTGDGVTNCWKPLSEKTSDLDTTHERAGVHKNGDPL